MKRRSFVKASLIAGPLSAVLPVIGEGKAHKEKAVKLEYYELREYTLKNDAQQQLVEAYFKDAFIPALNRIGVKQVGVFTELKPAGQTKLFCIIPFDSIEAFARLEDMLMFDAAYKNAAADYLQAPATAPAYERLESWLLRAFVNMPKLETPAQKPRIFELRRYESPTEAAGKKKIEMFNYSLCCRFTIIMLITTNNKFSFYY